LISPRPGSVDSRAGHFGLEPPEHSGQAANPKHPQSLSQTAALDQVAGDLKHFINRGAIESLQEQRDKPSDGRSLDRGIGMKKDSLTVELDEQIHRRLAFLDAMGGVFVGDQPIGQRGEILGEVKQELDAFLAVASAQVSHNCVQ